MEHSVASRNNQNIPEHQKLIIIMRKMDCSMIVLCSGMFHVPDFIDELGFHHDAKLTEILISLISLFL